MKGKKEKKREKKWKEMGVKKTQAELALCQVVNTLFSEEVNFNLKCK